MFSLVGQYVPDKGLSAGPAQLVEWGQVGFSHA